MSNRNLSELERQEQELSTRIKELRKEESFNALAKAIKAGDKVEALAMAYKFIAYNRTHSAGRKKKVPEVPTQ